MHLLRRLGGRACLAGIALAVLSACVPDIGPDPEACAAPTVRIDLTVTADALEPNDPAVCRGQDVTLTVDSDVAGVFHIHGYDEEIPATVIATGEEVTLLFTAERSGQFPIELHPAENPEGVELGVFTVYEP